MDMQEIGYLLFMQEQEEKEKAEMGKVNVENTGLLVGEIATNTSIL